MDEGIVMLRAVLAVLIAALLLGCSALEKSVEGVTLEWGNVTDSTTEIIAKVQVHNPLPFSIPLKVRTDVYANGERLGGGNTKVTLTPGDTAITVRANLDNGRIASWWVSHVRSGERSTLKIACTLSLDLGIFDFSYPLEFTRKIETDVLSNFRPKSVAVFGPARLDVELREVRWGRVSEKETEIVMVAKIHNTANLPIEVIGYDYAITANGVTLGSGSVKRLLQIPPSSEKGIEFTVKIENDRLAEWWVSHIKNGERSMFSVVLKPKVSVAGEKFVFEMANDFEFVTNLLGR